LVTVKIRDVKKRRSSYSWRFTVRDGSAPVTALSTTPAANTAGWHDTTATVTLRATDAAVSSGIANTYYTLNGGTTTAYTAPFTISAEGTTTVRYWSVDGAGNSETPKTATVKIDRTVPTIDGVSLSQSSTSSSDPTLTVSIADALSGVADASFVLLTEYPFQGLGTFDSSTGVLTYKPQAPLAGGRSGVAVEAVDVAGNHSWWFGYVTIPPTATFDGNGGTPASREATAAYNAALGSKMPDEPTRTGYTFVEWNTAEDGTGVEFNLATLLIADIKVYAQWTPNPQTVTFDGNGGSPASTDVATFYDATLGADMPDDPTRAHYTFASWNTAANGSGSTFTSATVITGDVTVYAQWTIDTHTVTFNGNGGSPDESTVTTDYGTALGASMPASPTLTGHTFASWNTAEDGSGDPFTGTTEVTADVTVYAQWTIDTHTVTFDGNGGSTPSPSTVTTDYGTALGASMPSDPTRAHYTFDGWNTAEDGSGDPFTGTTEVTADVTVYAQWTIDTHTVTFNGNGGSTPSPSTVTTDYGTALGADMPDDPTRAHYTFDGWNTAEDGSGDPFTGTTEVTADVTVYAQWTIDTHTVTFDGNGGSTPSPSTVTTDYGTALGASMPASPTLTDYAFTGWNTEEDGSGDPFTGTTEVTATITVYAQWAVTPTVTGLDVSTGGVAGGTTVVITGTGFVVGATTVDFGDNPATDVVVDSATQITCVSPAGTAGIVHVTVTTAGGTSATGDDDQFTYTE
jgi:uncharacterized repeat protein (TIGR02543 family)